MAKRAGLFESVDTAGIRTFGDPITITYSDLPAEDGEGVLEAAGERIAIVDGFTVASTRPSIGLHLEDWARAPSEGDTITRDGTVWDVGEVIPDGQGGISVELVLPRTA